jgi:hypothetical protein
LKSTGARFAVDEVVRLVVVALRGCALGCDFLGALVCFVAFEDAGAGAAGVVAAKEIPDKASPMATTREETVFDNTCEPPENAAQSLPLSCDGSMT